jgi:hypothetical protein
LDAPSPFPFAGHVLTPSFMVLIFFVLCLFASSTTSLFAITFKNPRDIYALAFLLIMNLSFEASSIPSLFEDNASSISSLTGPPSLTPCKLFLKYVLCRVFVRYHLNPCHPSIFTLMLILYLHFKAASSIPFQE